MRKRPPLGITTKHWEDALAGRYAGPAPEQPFSPEQEARLREIVREEIKTSKLMRDMDEALFGPGSDRVEVELG